MLKRSSSISKNRDSAFLTDPTIVSIQASRAPRDAGRPGAGQNPRIYPMNVEFQGNGHAVRLK